MKNLLLLLAFSLVSRCLTAQICGNPQSQIDIHGNNIQARILNGGDLFTDLSSGQFFPNPNPNSAINPSTIFAAGIWMGGVDGGGNLKLATADYRDNSHYDYTAGPLSPDGITDAFTCANWDRHFLVSGAEITSFLNALPLSAAELKTQFPGIAGWPGRGNPFFLAIYGFDLPFTNQALAPFFDANLDGNYNPLNGRLSCSIVARDGAFCSRRNGLVCFQRSKWWQSAYQQQWQTDTGRNTTDGLGF